MAPDADERRLARLGLAALLAARVAAALWYVARFGWWIPISETGLDRLAMARSWADHPSMVPDYGLWPAPIMWLDGPFLKLWPQPLVVPALLDQAFSLATLVLLYATARALELRRSLALALVAFWAFQPVTLWLSFSYFGETRAVFFVVYGLLAWLRYRRKPRLRWLVVAAAAFLIATTARLDAFAYSVVFSLLLAMEARRADARRRLALAGCALLSWSFALVYWGYWWCTQGSPFFGAALIKEMFFKSWLVSSLPRPIDRVLYFPKELLRAWHVWMLLAIPGMFALARTRRDLVLFATAPLAALCVAAANGQMSVALGPGPRHVLSHGLFWSLCAFALLERACARLPRPRLVVGTTALAVLVAAPVNLSMALVPRIHPVHYFRQLGDRLDALYASGQLAATDRILLLPCGSGCVERALAEDTRWDQSELLAHRGVILHPLDFGHPQRDHLPMERPDAATLETLGVRILIVSEGYLERLDRELMSAWRGALARVGTVMDYAVYVLAGDAAMERAVPAALASLDGWSIAYPAFARSSPSGLRLTTPSAPRWSPTFALADQPEDRNVALWDRAPTGDFTANVSFDAIALPTPSADRNELELDLYVGPVEFTLKRAQFAAGGCVSFLDFHGSDSSTNNCGLTSTRGELRLRRTGSAVCADFRDGGDWRSLGCRERGGGIGKLTLEIRGIGGAIVDVRFEGFAVRE